MNNDLLYKDIDNAERLLANIKFNVKWNLNTRKSYIIRDVQELKGMIDEAERLLNKHDTGATQESCHCANTM